MNRVAIVVLNWNGITDTLECLDSLIGQSYEHFKVVVVDNGSKDDSVKLLREYRSNHNNAVELVCNERNLGFTGGVNTGIRWALTNNYDGVALFNNDAVADKDWLLHLVAAAEPKEVGISTGLLLHEDGKTIDSTGDWFSKWGLPFPRNRDENTIFANKDGFVFGATGGATLYKTELFRDIGLFDDDFFAYYEDADISFRAQLAGWKVAYTSSAIAYHKRGATSNTIPGFAVGQTFKNLPWLFIKNVPTKLLLPVGIRFYTAYFLMFWNAVRHGAGWPALKGVCKNIILTPKKLGERWHIQKNKRVNASYIKSIFWNDLPPDQTGLRKLRKKLTGK